MLIQVENISKSYEHTLALQNISLSIAEGDACGIIGLSGAGKSTLIRCLSALIPVSSGRILFHGTDIAHMDKNTLRSFRKNIGMIFQHFNLLSSRTVAGNISYPLEVAKMSKEKRAARIDELLKLVGLREKKDLYPAQLSGGEKQRVGIARALASDPEILLCDEATSALDPKTTREILDLLKTINKNLHVTIILITHEMQVIKYLCNKVAVIDRGSIVEEGLVSDIFWEPKAHVTKQLLQNTIHDLPEELLARLSPKTKLLRLRFKGQAASEPLISHIVKRYHIDANILLGWVDMLQELTIGTLIIELSGELENIQGALLYLENHAVHCEILT